MINIIAMTDITLAAETIEIMLIRIKSDVFSPPSPPPLPPPPSDVDGVGSGPLSITSGSTEIKNSKSFWLKPPAIMLPFNIIGSSSGANFFYLKFHHN